VMRKSTSLQLISIIYLLLISTPLSSQSPTGCSTFLNSGSYGVNVGATTTFFSCTLDEGATLSYSIKDVYWFDADWYNIINEYGTIGCSPCGTYSHIVTGTGSQNFYVQIECTNLDFECSFDWQVSYTLPTAPPNSCGIVLPNTNAVSGQLVPNYPDGVIANTQNDCCGACNLVYNCTSWVYYPGNSDINCWLMMDVQGTIDASDSVFGSKLGIQLALDTCGYALPNTDQVSGQLVPKYPDGLTVNTQNDCCGLCGQDSNCTAWVYTPSSSYCSLMMDVQHIIGASDRVFGSKPGTHLALSESSGSFKSIQLGLIVICLIYLLI